jgi:transaldolase/glucose-6-phosphate isomerase
VAVANAKVAYRAYERMITGPRWEALARQGAMSQRLLWASTGTKNPTYSDVMYVDELIGPDTVNTVPPTTYAAFRDHGAPRASLTELVEDAEEALKLLARTGLSLPAATGELLDQGLELFCEAFDKLLATVGQRVESLAGRGAFRVAWPAALGHEVLRASEQWSTARKVQRLWAKDAGLWTGGDEHRWLGWLDNVQRELEQVQLYRSFAGEVRARGFVDVLLCGMGGSSLCPDVLARTFGPQPGWPTLRVIDSTDPAQVDAAVRSCDLGRTLVIVSSKSGSTLEPNILHRYAYEQVEQAVGRGRAGAHFVAVTDPGSQLEQVAEQDGFWRVFHGVPSIGGRYSALSAFGLVPAAAMGLDTGKLLERAAEMASACGSQSSPAFNPGLALGLILGQAARVGRDKLTLVSSNTLQYLGAWLEQLLAESTGKIGRGIIPVDGESLGRPELYGADRIFVALTMAGERDAKAERALAALIRAGQPVAQVELRDPYDLAGEFFRWEIATAVAGAELGIHPFDQPDVEASKIETRKLTAAFEQSGALPAETPIWSGEGVQLFADERNASAMSTVRRGKPALADWLRAHLERAGPGDYVALLAYLDMNPRHVALLQESRHWIRDTRRVATCLGFGPRFLHSTGQAYKGGPNSGVFLQITCDDPRDLPVPRAKFSFGVVKAAQARGDLAVLFERGRRALRVHFSSDVERGLTALRDALRTAAS